MKKYLQYGTTKDLSRSGRPLKLSKKNLNNIVNNRCGLSQRQIARRFKVHYSTISRNLQRRTSIVIRKRRKAPKMNNEQQVPAQKNCGKSLYRKLFNGCDLIMDDEKYFKLTGNNVIGNRYFYSTDPATALPKVNLQCKTKFEAKVMIWMGMSSKGTSDLYVHKSIQDVNQETYLKECINKRLLPFIAKYHSNGNYLFWPDLAKAHYSNIVQQYLTEKISHLFLVLTIHQMFLKLAQLRLYELYLNERYMKTIGKQKILIIWLKESNKKQKNLTKKCCKA